MMLPLHMALEIFGQFSRVYDVMLMQIDLNFPKFFKIWNLARKYHLQILHTMNTCDGYLKKK